MHRRRGPIQMRQIGDWQALQKKEKVTASCRQMLTPRMPRTRMIAPRARPALTTVSACINMHRYLNMAQNLASRCAARPAAVSFAMKTTALEQGECQATSQPTAARENVLGAKSIAKSTARSAKLLTTDHSCCAMPDTVPGCCPPCAAHRQICHFSA